MKIILFSTNIIYPILFSTSIRYPDLYYSTNIIYPVLFSTSVKCNYCLYNQFYCPTFYRSHTYILLIHSSIRRLGLLGCLLLLLNGAGEAAGRLLSLLLSGVGEAAGRLGGAETGACGWGAATGGVECAPAVGAELGSGCCRR